jgi:hypothetical protein
MACFRDERNEGVERERLTMRVIAGASTFNVLFSSHGNGIQTAGLRGSFIDESDDIINRQSSPGAQRLRVGITHEKRRPVVHQQTLHNAGSVQIRTN